MPDTEETQKLFPQHTTADFPKNCEAPFGLDPILATATDAYKLCAGHGKYNIETKQCDCFNNNEDGHWDLNTEDGSSTQTCRICIEPGWGPLPNTIGDSLAWCINRKTQESPFALVDCDDYTNHIIACNVVGQFNPNRAFVENPDTADLTWVPCAGHGTWKIDKCICHDRWAEGKNDKLNEISEDYKSCNECAPGYGPTPPNTKDYKQWRARGSRLVSSGPFCVGPVAKDPECNDDDCELLLCAGHGYVETEGTCSCIDSYVGKSCNETATQ